MSSSVPAFRTRWGTRVVGPAEARERSVRRRVSVAWGLLVLNVLTYGGSSVVQLPHRVGQAITQAALPLALLLALTVNRRVVIRPSVFLCLVSLLAMEAILTSLQAQHLGTVYRTFRLVEFVITLWVLTPWWGRRDLLLVRVHLTTMAVVLGSVLLGLLVAPGLDLNSRLGGVLWPIPATQVAHYAAITAGLVILLWICGLLRGRVTLPIVIVAVTILILTHTRTALVGMIAGIGVAGLSLIVAKARARKLFVIAGGVAGIGVMTLSGVITSWLARGEGNKQLIDLSGRTLVWGAVLRFPRDRFHEIFGFGLSNASFNGLAIDSNWLASYQMQGLFGVIVCIIILLFLLAVAYLQARGVQRALALFLVTYCLLASFTEVGFADASAYLLDLFLAASLLVPSATSKIAP